MALTVTSRLTAQSTGFWGTGAYTTGAFTPSNNSLLVAVVYEAVEDGSSDVGQPSIASSPTLSWSFLVRCQEPTSWAFGASVFTAPVTTGASTTITVDDDNNENVAGWIVHAFDLTDYDTVTPTGGTATSSPSSIGDGAETQTLSAAPATADITFVFLTADVGGSPPAMNPTWGTGTWTTFQQIQIADPGQTTLVGYRTGSTSTSVPVTDIYTSAGTVAKASMMSWVIKAFGGNVPVGNAAVGVAANAPTITRNDAYVVASAGAAITTNDPAVTFAGTYTPLENDVICLFVSSTTVLGAVANASLPAGWVNPLGDGVEVNSDAHGMACFYHLVTAAEQTAVTLTYTATDALDATETGYVQGVAVRNVDPANVVDGFNTAFDSANTVTPHVFAGITGAGVLIANSLVVSSVAKDATGAYSSIPGGWQQLRADNTNNGRWLGYRDALTVVDTDVTATNITPSAGDEYASITLAFARAPAAGTNVTVGNAAVTVTGNNAAHAIAVNVGVATVTTTANNASSSVKPTTGNAAVTATANNSSASVKPTTGTAAVTVTGNQVSSSVATYLQEFEGGVAYVFVLSENVDVTTTTATNVDVGVATVTATANNSSAAVAGGVGSAPVTTTGNNSSASVKPTAGSAAVTTTANNVTAAPSPSAGNAAVTSTANNSSATVASTIGTSVVTVAGNNATPATTSNVNVDVGSAAVTVAGNDSSSSVKPTTGSAAVTVTGNNVDHQIAPTIGTSVVTVTGNNTTPATTTNVNVDVGSAAVTATANNSSASVKPTTQLATVTVAANQVTVSTDSNKSVAVGSATVSATANTSSSSIKPTTQLAAVTVAGNNAGHELTVTAGVAAVTSTANNSSAAIAASVAAALVLVVANNLQPDNGEGIATLIGLIRASRPDLIRISRPYPHHAQRPEVT